MSLQVKPMKYCTRSIECLTYSILCHMGADSVFPPAKPLVDFDDNSTSGKHMRAKIKLAGFSLTPVTTGDLFWLYQIYEDLRLQVSERSK